MVHKLTVVAELSDCNSLEKTTASPMNQNKVSSHVLQIEVLHKDLVHLTEFYTEFSKD